MPASPRKSKPDTLTHVVLRLPGRLKNEMVAHAESLGVPYTQWCVETLVRAVRDGQGLPPPPPAVAPLPTPVDSLQAYLRGERLLLPCGREGLSCVGTESPERLGSSLYCRECHIRV